MTFIFIQACKEKKTVVPAPCFIQYTSNSRSSSSGSSSNLESILAVGRKQKDDVASGIGFKMLLPTLPRQLPPP